MNEPGWLTFYTGAREIEQRLGVNQAEAQAKLRRACAEQKIRSMKAPYDDLNQLPIEFWTRVAPSEWREREVDYDGPDADGCAIEVMINETEFLDWLNKQQPDKPGPAKSAPKQTKSSPKRDLAKQAIKALWPSGIPSAITNKQLERQVADWITGYCKRESLPKPDISRDTILRAADRK